MKFSMTLEQFIFEKDNYFNWRITHDEEKKFFRLINIEFVSHKLQNSFLKPHIWQHQLLILIPHTLSCEKLYLHITREPYDLNNLLLPDPVVSDACCKNQMISCELRQVPNQPLISKLNTPHEGDDLLAKSFFNFMNSNLIEDILLMSMVRSITDAMDIIKDCTRKNNSFILSGKSKQGWAVWLTSAFRNDVSDIIPVVADVLNLKELFLNHSQTFPHWTAPVQDFVVNKVTDLINSDKFTKLCSVIDPINYLDRFTKVSKHIISATGDELFLSDHISSYFYKINDCTLTYLINSGHQIEKTSYRQDILALIHVCNNPERFAEINHNLYEGEKLWDETSWKKIIFKASNNQKDFRKNLSKVEFKPVELIDDTTKDNRINNDPAPEQQASFIQLFTKLDQYNLRFHTPIKIIS